MKTLTIVLVRCPQPMLVGERTCSLYSPNRSLTPEPTLPQLGGIIKQYAEKNNIEIKVTQLDLRNPTQGKVEVNQYGKLLLPYVPERILKIFSGIKIGKIADIFHDADFIGFTNNFAMARRVVCDHISFVRSHFKKKEIWIGGRDLYTDRVKDIYAHAAEGNCVIFDGHVFESLPAYLDHRLFGAGEIFGVTIYNKMAAKKFPGKPLIAWAKNGVVDIPLPIYDDHRALEYFTGSGEGNPFIGKFVHMTISLGCPFACGYCTTGYRERYLVHKSLPQIDAELDMYGKLGVKIIAIMDDNLLGLEAGRVAEIMSLINARNFQIEFGNGLMLSALVGKNWAKLSQSLFEKCVSLYAPLEDLTTDRMYDKLAPINMELELMRRIRNAEFPNLRYVTMGAILGVPGHTKEKLAGNFMENTKKFLDIFAGSPIEIAMTVFNFMPLPGTIFGEIALNSGRMVVADPFYKDPEVCSFGTTSYAPEGITHAEIFSLYEQALNLNPAGKDLGISYVELQRHGSKALIKIPEKWRIPGFHLREKMRTSLV